MKIILEDVNDYNLKVELSESAHGNVVIEIDNHTKVIVKPDELLRAVRLFVADRNGDTTT